MNSYYNKYSIFIPNNRNTTLSQRLLIEKHFMLIEAIDRYGPENINSLKKYLNIWFNIKYLNCQYSSSLYQKSKNHFDNVDYRKKYS